MMVLSMMKLMMGLLLALYCVHAIEVERGQVAMQATTESEMQMAQKAHALAQELLEALPHEQARLKDNRHKLLEAVKENMANIKALNEYTDRHKVSSFLAQSESIRHKQARLLKDVEESHAALVQLHQNHNPNDRLFALHDHLKAKNDRIQQQIAKDYETMKSLGLELPPEAQALIRTVAWEQVKREEAINGIRSAHSQHPATSEESEEAVVQGGEPSESEQEKRIHRFKGMPQHVQFQIGQGHLDCTCEYADGPGRPGATHLPWMPAPLKASAVLSGPHCFESCQEHKCSTVYREEGWDKWYQCIGSCVVTCYQKDANKMTEALKAAVEEQ